MQQLDSDMITPETVKATRHWFAENYQACIDEAISGKVFVNNLPLYVEQMTKRKAEALSGQYDHTLTFRQKAVYIQTGVCHAILP